jgi:uncharacterized membrane protein YdjX (TVP38/TMEM64 family)
VSESAAKEQPPAVLGGLRRVGQALIAAAVIAAIAAAWRWRGEFDPLALTDLIRLYPAAPLVFLGLHVIASLAFVPRSLLGIAAGLVFGIWWGLFWAALGSVVGALAGFLLARYVHAALFDRARWSRFAAILDRAERGGWRMVAMIRLVPVIPHSLSNYALGLTRLRLADYALGSLLGQLPLTIASVELGAAGERAMRGAGDWIVPTAVGFTALALSVAIPALARRRPVKAPAE